MGNLVNGWYKCTSRYDSGFTEGKYYLFADGRTVDDNGRCRPDVAIPPQEYGDMDSKEWFDSAGLVPAKYAPNKFHNGDLVRVVGPRYGDRGWVPGMNKYIGHVYSVAQVLPRSTEEGFVYHLNTHDGYTYCFGEDELDSVSNWKAAQNLAYYAKCDAEATAEILEAFGKTYMIRRFPKVGEIVRDKHTLTAYRITKIKQFLVNGEQEYGVWFRSLNTGLPSDMSYDHVALFWENFELFDPEIDGWNGKMFSNKTIYDSYSRVLLLKDRMVNVRGGLVSKDCDIYIKSPSELEKVLANGLKLTCVIGECPFIPKINFSYTGKAYCKKTNNLRGFSGGYLYTFCCGMTKNDFGTEVFFNESEFGELFTEVDSE